MPATVTASRMSKIERSKVQPLSVSATTLPSSVASVNGDAVEAVTDSVDAVTGSCAARAKPLYPVNGICSHAEGEGSVRVYIAIEFKLNRDFVESLTSV